ncbi:MAG: SDR family NAD(P)-dependent oxidoreductase, partial [Planctomycetales bacterium]|nr:SDR family NAD(P)-dependent oxidoreductase [Planctomycetales bacterium]
MIRLDGHAALVTGGSRGIGRATARMLARAGAAVAVGYHERRDAAEEVASEISRAGGRAVALSGDVTSPADCEALAAGAAKALGPLSIVVANAGTWRPTPFPDFSPDEWDRLVRENLTSKALTVRAALPHARRDCRFVLVSSTAGQRGEAGHAAYAASQGGTIALVRSLATELGPRGMRVNGVAPGWVRT